MPIIFMNEKARKQLLENGIAYTLRQHARKTKGKDWATDKRGGKKIADVYIKLERRASICDLMPFIGQSGFNSLDE